MPQDSYHESSEAYANAVLDMFPNCSSLKSAISHAGPSRGIVSPAGHAVAGSFYILWGLWWMFMAFWLYLTTKVSSRQTSNPLSNFTCRNNRLFGKSWIPQPFWPNVPLEPIVKVVLPSLGMFAETFINVIDGQVVWIRYQVVFNDACGAYGDLNRLYHIALYMCFVISGVVDILALYLKPPHLTSQIFQCLAFYNQFLLFAYHVHGRDVLSVTVHGLINFFVLASALFATLRMLNPENLLFNAGLAGSMILQGTNLVQAGVLLNGPYIYNPLSNNNTKFIAVVTTWHITGISLFMLLTFASMKVLFRRFSSSKQKVYLPLDAEESSPSHDLEGCSESVNLEMQELLDEKNP